MELQTFAPKRMLDAVARCGAWIGGACLLVSSMLIVIDLVMRKWIGWSMGGADEIAGYVLAIVSAWAFPITLLRRSHIRVDVVYTHLPRQVRIGLDLFALFCLGVFVAVLTYHAWQVLADSISFNAVSNTPLQVPQWIPQSLWFAGYVFFLITILALMFCAVYLIVKRRPREVSALIGIHSVEEEINEEVVLETDPCPTHQALAVAEK
ncbi:TRAP transporter small permease subunit [Advenella mimigardefordensis]|uniref:TRAP transporter small permease protein n=1 Tax=Advenella mimigardefordensis (strain DSM 17166 / LMG 22922 / DPN7) TaxID=1247726 RepID=W0PBG5_ADVMD|nr:TRAP transporter small permease [Advenella mimigardefordensis]AHG64081.1 putative TRAP transporter, DctQ subunit [Advenella mimigardefordensis DPN7]